MAGLEQKGMVKVHGNEQKLLTVTKVRKLEAARSHLEFSGALYTQTMISFDKKKLIEKLILPMSSFQILALR